MIEPTAALLLDNPDLLEAERLLVVGAPRGDSVAAIDRASGGRARFYFAEHPARIEAGLAARGRGGPWYSVGTDPAHDAAVMFLPKGKRRRDMWLSMVAGAVVAGGRVTVIGHNQEGAKSAGKAAHQYFDQIVTTDHGHHSRLVVVRGAKRSASTLDDFADSWTLPRSAGALSIVSLPGVFSDGRLDSGTALLLEHVRIARGASVLDLGCGAGVIGTVLARDHGAAVTMVDADYLAVEATQRTAAAAGIDARVAPSDVYSAVDGCFDAVVCNPPFHQGVKTEYDVAEEIIAGAPRMLQPGGELWLVANGFLPYAERIAASFGNCDTVAKDRHFAVYRARRC